MSINKVFPGSTDLGAGYSAYPGMASGVDSATGRPYSTSEMEATALQLDAKNTTLTFRATLSDVFVASMGNVVKNHNSDEFTLPDTMCMKMTAPNGAKTMSMTVADPLRGATRAGDDQQSGFEIGQRMRYMLAHYNEYSQAVSTTTRGVEHNTIQGQFKLYDYAQPQLSKYFQEIDGRQFRQSSLETYSSELIKDRGLNKHWNPNVFIANVDPGSQPAYDSTLQAYTASITDAMAGAATGTNGVNANVSIEYLDALQDHAETNLRIEPLMTGGGETYIVVLPSNQVAKLTSLVGVLGEMWQRKTALTTDELTYPGVIGRYKKLLIVSDSRYATLEAVYTSSSEAMAVTYVEPGNEDTRNKTVYTTATNQAWSIGGLYGSKAFLDWTVRDLHYAEEEAEYKKYKGIGAFTERGIQLALIRTDPSTVGAPDYVENQSSIALFFTNTSIMTVK
jgi:hypothetical protein